MAEQKSYRWLSAGALVALALAAFVAVVAVRHAADDHTRATDVKTRAEETMRQIEAQVDQLENEAGAK
ncbi:hypothetical protein [Sphingomonas trueperi]|uniref:hypothetical protein n=1 Tax=Sphingomonas trueperi TaxID=53317 RepID=UPI000EB50746